ncbi:glutathione peroxidase [Gammaproteobacteria bacterium]
MKIIDQIKRKLGIGLLGFGVIQAVAAGQCPPLLDHTFAMLQDGKPMPLCQFAGKVVLVVNTASYCGFTSQYDGLEKLYGRLKGQGLVVLGFPSNDFGAQEPGSDKEIADFCRLTYGVEFPMVSKTVVKGSQSNAFYKRLGEITGSAPRWNFHKYLINRDGTQVLAFGSMTKPDDKELLAKIDEFLKQP